MIEKLPSPSRISLNEFLASQGSDAFALDAGAGGSPYGHLFPNRVAFDIVTVDELDICGDLHQLPFSSNSFEIILSTEALEHVQEPQRVVHEFYRILVPGGKCILTTRFIFPIHDKEHDYYRFTRFGLEYLFRDWHLIELMDDVDDVATIMTFIHYALARKERTRVRRLLYNIWRPIWAFFKLNFRHRRQQTVFSKHRLMPSGYHLVAKKPVQTG